MKKILIIEDNRDIRENIAEILELADYAPLAAANGKEGVALACSEAPDLILCDVMMPELDGYGVLHILSKKEATANIPFIFLTAKAERVDLRKGMLLGADDYLTKPFDDTELLEAIETRLRKHALIKGSAAQLEERLTSSITSPKDFHNFLFAAKTPRKYPKKYPIYHLSDPPLYLYYVAAGKVKTLRATDEGKEFITEIYQPGEYFGYEALLNNQPHTDSAETIEAAEVSILPKDEFNQLVEKHPQLGRKFIDMLSLKLEEREQQLLHLAYNSIRQRTAEALLLLHKKSASSAELNLSRENLANLVGTATESVIRTLSDFKEEGLISITSGKIQLLEVEALRKIAG